MESFERVASNLSTADVKNFKFICEAGYIQRRLAERIKTGFHLLCVLAERNHISPLKLELLEYLLGEVHTTHLHDPLRAVEGRGPPAPNPEAQTDNLNYNTNELERQLQNLLIAIKDGLPGYVFSNKNIFQDVQQPDSPSLMAPLVSHSLSLMTSQPYRVGDIPHGSSTESTASSDSLDNQLSTDSSGTFTLNNSSLSLTSLEYRELVRQSQHTAEFSTFRKRAQCQGTKQKKLPPLFPSVMPSALHTLPESHTVLNFIDPVEIIHCDSSGGIYRNPRHGLTLLIPEGAIPHGEHLEISIGVGLYGDFSFPSGLSPVSAIVWLCSKPEIEFLKPVQVIIPHFLECQSKEDAECFEMQFMKASHWNSPSETAQFLPADGEADFTSVPNKGILHTKHFCYLCICAGVTPEQLKSCRFCISCAIPQLITTGSHVHFYVHYFLETCIQSLNQQLDERHYIKTRKVFKFSHDDTPVITGEYQCSAAKRPVTLTLQPTRISEDMIDFWKLHYSGELKLFERRKLYPPSMMLMFGDLSSCEEQVVTVLFKGTQQPVEQMKIEIVVPSSEGTPSKIKTSHPEPALRDIPTIHKLMLLKTVPEETPVRIIQTVMPQWKDLALMIDFDSQGRHMQLIEKELGPEGPVACCKQVFVDWLYGKGDYQPPTWENLLQILDDMEYSQLAIKLRRSLLPGTPSKIQTLHPKPALRDKLTLRQLVYLKTVPEETPVRIIQTLAPQWKDLGVMIDFDPQGRHMQSIMEELGPEGPLACCRQVFMDWLDGKGANQPPTWENLLKILKDMEQDSLAATLHRLLLPGDERSPQQLKAIKGEVAIIEQKTRRDSPPKQLKDSPEQVEDVTAKKGEMVSPVKLETHPELISTFKKRTPNKLLPLLLSDPFYIHVLPESHIEFTDPAETIHCDSAGGIYHNPWHGITILIPEGAIPYGKRLEISIGAGLCGNFSFPSGHSPVSAIVWLCSRSATKFLKPIEVKIPHFLDCASKEDAESLEMQFMKAGHWNSTSETTQFLPADGEADFISVPNKGILHIQHFCHLCITAGKTPEQLKRSKFCIAYARPQSITSGSCLYFYVLYLLDTCIQCIQNQLADGYFLDQPMDFRFSDVSHGEPAITGEYQCSAAQPVMTLQPTSISENEVDFRKLHENGELKLREAMKMYPPNMKLEFGNLSSCEEQVVTVQFRGTQKPVEKMIIIPGLTGTSIPSEEPDAVLDSQHLLEITHYLHCLDKPNLYNLGLVLGLHRRTIVDLRDGASSCQEFCDSIVDYWLQKVDNVEAVGMIPSWRNLVTALKHHRLGQNGLANQIAIEKLRPRVSTV